MSFIKYFTIIILSVLLFSCRWEKVDYGQPSDNKSFEEKVKSIHINDLGTLVLGTEKIVVPIEIEGYYKDADKYKISDINKSLKVFYKPSGSDKSIELRANIFKEDKEYLEIFLPAFLSNGIITLFIDGEKKGENEVKVSDIDWALFQDNGDADSWSNRAKIHFRIKRHKGDESFVPLALRATIKELNGKEETPLTINPNLEEETLLIKSLKPATSYIVTYYLSGTDKKISKQITTEKAEQVPNNSFEDWGEVKKKDCYWEFFFPYQSNIIEGTPHWDTLNKLTCRYGLVEGGTALRYRANSSTIPTDDAHSGNKAVKIRTVGYGKNATAAGSWSLNVEVSLGSLYLGSFNDEILKNKNTEPHLGIPFSSRPKNMVFWAKYNPKNPSDRFVAEIVLLDSNGEKIAEGVLPKEDAGKTQDNQYHKYTLPLEYKVYDKKPTKMYIRFMSGRIVENKSSNINYGSVSSSSEHTGSELFVDDIELLY